MVGPLSTSSAFDPLAPLLERLCTPPPDREVWNKVKRLAEGNDPTFLSRALSAVLKRRPLRLRARGAQAVAGAVGDDGANLLTMLLRQRSNAARHLALALAASTVQPLTTEQLTALGPLLSDRRLPADLKEAVLVTVLQRTLPGDDPRARSLLEASLAGRSEGRALRRLGRVQKRVGPHPILDALHAELEAKAPMRCPRCQARFPQHAMGAHLWQEHQLVLEGRKVREPWSMIEDWLAEGPPTPDLLERCKVLAQRLDPEGGTLRLEKMLRPPLPLPPPPLPPILVEEDPPGENESRCPHCRTTFDLPRPTPAEEVVVRSGRISSVHYEIVVAEHGLRTHLTIRTPMGVLYDGCEPGQQWTLSGALLLLAGPLVGLALLQAPGLLAWLIDPVSGVVVCLALALGAGLWARRDWKQRRSARDRALNYAWTLLVPRFHAVEFSLTESAFLAGLARVSAEAGDPASRALVLITMLQRTHRATEDNPALAQQLALLRRLEIQDGRRDGQDPTPQVVSDVMRALEGPLPLSYAHELLARWATDWWTVGELARLRVLICDRAFEAGLEVSHLHALGHGAPALAAVLMDEELGDLTHLRFLWSQRALRPWDWAESTLTVFEWAARSDSAALLTEFPDLLFVQSDANRRLTVAGHPGPEQPLQLVICGRGVALQGVLFRDVPEVLEVVRRGLLFRGGYELTVDDQTFYCNWEPDDLASQLERWFRFLHREFLPQTGKVLHWSSPVGEALVRRKAVVPCPHCQRPLVPVPGASAEGIDPERFLS